MRTAAVSNGTEVADRASGKAAKGIEQNFSRLREITLEEPIRYGKGDSVEKWRKILYLF